MSSKRFMSFIKRKSKDKDVAKLLQDQDIAGALTTAQAEGKKMLDGAVGKLDAFAADDKKTEKVADQVSDLIDKATGNKDKKKQSMQKRAVSFAIRNWRYSMPFLMSALTFLASQAWLIILVGIIVLIVKSRFGGKSKSS